MQPLTPDLPAPGQHRAPFVMDPATGDRCADQVLFSSPSMKIVDRVQVGARTGWGATRGGGAPSIVFLRAGLFECKTPTDYVFTDSTHVKCYDGQHEYRFQRLQDGGEAYTLICPNPELMEELFGKVGFQVTCSSDIHYRHLELYRALHDGELDQLEIEETALGLLADVAAAFGACDEIKPAGPRVRRRIQAAQAYLAADPAKDHRLADVAGIAGCSEFHFARLFRAETGQSLRSYRRRLRMRLALRLISEGQDNLTTVAMDAGFNTHSHMTATFQEDMGRTPSAARQRIAMR